MKLQDLGRNWLLGGADPEVGLRLFMDYTKPALPIARILSAAPEKHLQTIKVSLLRAAGLPLDMHIVRTGNSAGKTSTVSKRVRNDWPFLSDPDCPPELKLLISDKITAYRNCIESYNKLPDCVTPVEQLNAARNLVTNFVENHDIYKELKYFKDSG